MKQTLTPRQAKVLDYIKADGRVAPSYREIADHMGWKSMSLVDTTIKALIERGYLDKPKYRSRCFVIKG